MKKIKELEIISRSDSFEFEKDLKEQINKMQDNGLEVTINNPHIVRSGSLRTYMATIEGRANDTSGAFPPFNINPKS